VWRCFAWVNDLGRTCEGSLLGFDNGLTTSWRCVQPKGRGGKLSMATLVVVPYVSVRVKFDLGLREKITSDASATLVGSLSDDNWIWNGSTTFIPSNMIEGLRDWGVDGQTMLLWLYWAIVGVAGYVGWWSMLTVVCASNYARSVAPNDGSVWSLKLEARILEEIVPVNKSDRACCVVV